MIKKLQSLSNWSKAFVISSIFFCAIFILLTPIYEVNDDVFLNLLSNGYYTGTPSPYLFNIHTLSGFFLNSMYRHWPGINWYSIILYTCSWVSFTTFSYIIFTYKNRMFKFFAFTFIAISYLRFMLYLSFTTVAAIVATSGIIMLIRTVQLKRKNFNFYLIYACILLILTQFIRWGILDLIVGLSVPLLIAVMLQSKQYRVPLIMAAFIVLVIILSLRYYQKHSYPTTPEWKKTMTALSPISWCFYAPRFCEYDSQYKAYTAAGWSNNDYIMLFGFYYDSEDIFSNTKAQIVSSNIQPALALTTLPDSIRGFIMMLVMLVLEFFFLCKMMQVYFARKFFSIVKLPHILSYIISACALLYFGIQGYLPDRVFYSILFFLGTVILFTTVSDHENESHLSEITITFIYSALIALILVSGFRYWQFSNNHKVRIANFKKMYKSLPSGKNDVTYVWTFPFEWQDALEDPSYIKQRNIIYASWMQRSVYNDSIKQKFGITNVYTDLYNKSNYYLVATKYQQNFLKIFIKEHYNTDVQFQTLDDYTIYGFPAYLVKVVSVKE